MNRVLLLYTRDADGRPNGQTEQSLFCLSPPTSSSTKPCDCTRPSNRTGILEFEAELLGAAVGARLQEHAHPVAAGQRCDYPCGAKKRIMLATRGMSGECGHGRKDWCSVCMRELDTRSSKLARRLLALAQTVQGKQKSGLENLGNRICGCGTRDRSAPGSLYLESRCTGYNGRARRLARDNLNERAP